MLVGIVMRKGLWFSLDFGLLVPVFFLVLFVLGVGYVFVSEAGLF